MPETSASKPFKLLIAGMRWPPETFLARLIDGLLKAGLEVTVATAKRPDADWRSRVGFSWLPAPAWQGNYPLRLLRLAWNMGRGWVASPSDMGIIGRQVRQSGRLIDRLRLWQRWSPYAGQRWDVIYFPWNSGAIEHLALFELGMPVVLSCRGSQINVALHNPERSRMLVDLKTSFDKAKSIHCVSKDILQNAVNYGLDPQKAIVIYPAVDTEFFKPEGKSQQKFDKLRITTVGRLTWVKGYEYALIAMSQLKSAGIPFQYDIIGDGPERQRILYTVHDLEIENEVHLLGDMPQTAVRDHLRTTDIFLLSSVSEGFSNAVVEAQSLGIPVVCTNTGGLPENVLHDATGIIVPVREPEAIAQALSKLWQDPTLRHQMGMRGRERVLEDFNQDKQVTQFLDILWEALNR